MYTYFAVKEPQLHLSATDHVLVAVRLLMQTASGENDIGNDVFVCEISALARDTMTARATRRSVHADMSGKTTCTLSHLPVDHFIP